MKAFISLFAIMLFFSAINSIADEVKIVGTNNTTSTLRVDGQNINLKFKSRISFALVATPQELGQGKIRVKHFNVLTYGVPQGKLSGKTPRSKNKTGPLGFALLSESRPVFRYDASRRLISGQLSGRVDFPQLEELFPPNTKSTVDYYSYPTQAASVKVRIKLSYN